MKKEKRTYLYLMRGTHYVAINFDQEQLDSLIVDKDSWPAVLLKEMDEAIKRGEGGKVEDLLK